MRKLKKISALLSVLLTFAISVGTFPLSALAQYYTINDNTGYADYTYSGEIQAPNSSVLSGLGAVGASVGALPFSENFPTPPSFSAGANNNWSTSLLSRTFSIVGSDNVGNYCNVSQFSNSSLGLNVSFYDDETGRTTWNTSCSPDVSVETTRNANGNASGRPVAVQTSEVLPLAVFEENTLVTRVESIQNDPNNVRVTIGVDSTIEAYGARFQRIDGISDWVGHVAIDTEIGRVSLSDVEKSNDAQLPQGVKIGASSSSESGSIERPRNSDVVAETQPKCTQWTDGSAWRTVQHVHCVTYSLSADGRTGRSDYYDSQSAGTFLQALVTIGVGFAVGYFIGPGLIDSLSSVTSIAGETLTVGADILSGVSSITTLSGVVDATVAAASGASTIGTVESTVASSPPYGTEKAWVWTWSELPAQPIVTNTCQNGANNPPTCSTCTAPKIMNSSGVCAGPVTTPIIPTVGRVPSLPQSVTVTVCSGNQTWSGSSCVVTPPVTPPVVTPPVTPPSGDTPSGGTPGGGAPGNQDMGNQGGQNQGGQNQGCQGSQGVSSATIYADPNRVPKGTVGGNCITEPDSCTVITWCTSQVDSCAVSGPGLSSTNLSGSQPVTINEQSTFEITCQTNGLPITNSVIVNVVVKSFKEF